MEGVPAHGRGLEVDGLKRCLLTQTLLSFYEMFFQKIVFWNTKLEGRQRQLMGNGFILLESLH